MKGREGEIKVQGESFEELKSIIQKLEEVIAQRDEDLKTVQSSLEDAQLRWDDKILENEN